MDKHRLMTIAVLFQVLSGALILAFSWGVIPPAELISTSDFVVVATLTSVHQDSNQQVGHGTAKLLIREDVLGNIGAVKILNLYWNDVLLEPDYSAVNGREAVWFLRKGHDGSVEATNPSRFMAADDCQRLTNLKLGLEQSAGQAKPTDRLDKVTTWITRQLRNQCSQSNGRTAA